MDAILQNKVNTRPDIILAYVIVDTRRDGRALETLAFDKTLERKTLELTDENSEKKAVRRSASTPMLMGFHIDPNDVIKLDDLKDMHFIDSGLQSVVYRAMHKTRRVAVKVMQNHFENEIENLRKLRHENIVEFIGACSGQGKVSIVMEYCEKGSLYKYLHSPDVSIDPARLLEWSYQIASGMAFLHQNNVIHRDLKSPNILINHDFMLKISDFGLSKPKLTDSAKMPCSGTTQWMAPEVILLKPCSDKVDVWSYGVVLWELLTLRIPYHDYGRCSLIIGIGSQQLRLKTPKSFPEPFRGLILQCWRFKPEERPTFKSIVASLMNDRLKVQKIDKAKFAKLRKEWMEECEKCVHEPNFNLK